MSAHSITMLIVLHGHGHIKNYPKWQYYIIIILYIILVDIYAGFGLRNMCVMFIYS